MAEKVGTSAKFEAELNAAWVDGWDAGYSHAMGKAPVRGCRMSLAKKKEFLKERGIDLDAYGPYGLAPWISDFLRGR